jgi:hypothetical protein
VPATDVILLYSMRLIAAMLMVCGVIFIAIAGNIFYFGVPAHLFVPMICLVAMGVMVIICGGIMGLLTWIDC